MPWSCTRAAGDKASSAKEQGDLPTCEEAAYGKLRRLPIPLSLGFFEDVTELIGPLMPEKAQVARIPASLAEMRVTILDGKQLKKVAKRLKPVRSKAGRVVGGKILVAYLPAEGLAVAMAADPDGEANDIRLMPEVVPPPCTNQRRPALGGRPPILRSQPARVVDRAGGSFPDPPVVENPFPSRSPASGPDESRLAGTHRG